jgi:hypothetical protein
MGKGVVGLGGAEPTYQSVPPPMNMLGMNISTIDCKVYISAAASAWKDWMVECD